MTNVIKIEVKEGQTGYKAVQNWLVEYWRTHTSGDSVICLELSYNDKDYDRTNELVEITGFAEDDVEWVNDWWKDRSILKFLELRILMILMLLNVFKENFIQ